MAGHIDDAVRAALSRQHVGGASLAIAEHGRIVYSKGYGLRNIDNALPADANTSYRIGSITKQFTAASIMLLAQAGRLNVNDRLSTYLPTAPHAREITIRQMLSHTSGIADYTDQPTFERDVLRPATPEQVVATVARAPLAFKPGTRWQYSNTNFFLLGMVIAKLSGQPYEQFVREHLIDPLGLGSAVFYDPWAITSDAADGYETLALGQPIHATYWNYDWTGGAGGLSMSAPDLARWDIALDAGKVVTLASFAEMSTTIRLPDGSPTGYGYGLGIRKFLGRTVISHGGSVPGFGAANWTIPADSLAIVLLSNGENFYPGPIVRDIAATLYGVPVPIRTVRPVAESTPERIRSLRLIEQALTGTLRPATFDLSMRSQPHQIVASLTNDLAALGKRLGTAPKLELVSIDRGSPVTTYSYRATFPSDTLDCELALSEVGTIDSIFFAPWYDY